MSTQPNEFDKQQCVKYATEIRQILGYIFSHHIFSRSQISSKTGINEHKISQFLIRTAERPKYSNTACLLYKFLIDELDQDFIRNDTETFANHSKMLLSKKNLLEYSSILFQGIIDYVGSSRDEIDKAGIRCGGSFFVYRKSIFENRIVKTKLDIFPEEDAEKIWSFRHSYKDGLGNIRETSGIITVNVGNVCCMGRINGGFGIDILVFKMPIAIRPPAFQALVMTLDTNLQPIIAKAIVKSADAETTEDFGGFDWNEVKHELGGFERFIDKDVAVSLDVL